MKKRHGSKIKNRHSFRLFDPEDSLHMDTKKQMSATEQEVMFCAANLEAFKAEWEGSNKQGDFVLMEKRHCSRMKNRHSFQFFGPACHHVTNQGRMGTAETSCQLTITSKIVCRR